MPQPSLGAYRRIAILFLCLTAIIAIVVAYVVFSKARVVILAKQDEVRADFVADVSRVPQDSEIRGDVVSFADSVTQQFPAASVVKVDTHAEGTVRISSALSRNQTLVATTRLLTADGALYRIKKTVVVPADGAVEVAAFADEAGPNGELANGTFTIPGLDPALRRSFTVTVVAPFVAGQKDEKLVTQDDVNSAVDVLKQKLGADLTERLRNQAKQDGAPTSGEIISIDITKQTTDQPVGAEADTFTVTLAIKATGVFYDAGQLDDQLKAQLKLQIPYDRALAAIEDDSVMKTVDKADADGGKASVHVTAKALAVLSTDSPALNREKFTGVTVDAARAYLEHLDGVSSASVTVSPFWVGRMPNVADHITIEVR